MRYALAAVAVLLASAPAGAAVQTFSVAFTSDAFNRIGTPSSENPVPPIPGRLTANGRDFVFSYDPTTQADFTLTGQQPNWWTGTFQPSSFILSYVFATDTLTIDGTPLGTAFDQNDYDLHAVIDGALFGFRQSSTFLISSAASPGGYWQARYVMTPVPEPAEWAMLIAGFGMLGGAIRAAKSRPSFALQSR